MKKIYLIPNRNNSFFFSEEDILNLLDFNQAYDLVLSSEEELADANIEVDQTRKEEIQIKGE